MFSPHERAERVGEVGRRYRGAVLWPGAAIIIGSTDISIHIYMQYCTTTSPQLLIFFFPPLAQGMIIKNMSFKVGQTLTLIGVARPEASK